MADDSKKTPAAPVAAPAFDPIAFAKALAQEIVAALKPAPEAPAERPAPAPLDPKYKGAKTYRIKAPHYRAGVLYETGSLITVTDEKPSKTWELATPESEAAAAVPQPIDLSKKTARPSDAQT